MAHNNPGSNLETLLPECPICFGIMRGARLMNCGHTYCQECLEKEVERSPAPHRVIACPECRAEMPLGPDGVGGLKRNFSIQAIIDKYDNMTIPQADTTEQEVTDPAPTEEKYIVKCDRHTGEVAYFICETCDNTLICRVCTGGDHFQHQFVNVRGKSEGLKGLLLARIAEHQKLTEQVIGRDQRAAVDSVACNAQRLENEVKQTAQKKILAIQKERDKQVLLAQHIGQVMEERINNMYYNETPIDTIAEMVVRDNEYEITEGFDEAMNRLDLSIAELKEKMGSSILPEVAKCLSFKEEESRSTKLCDLVLSNTSWKAATSYVDITENGNILAFSCDPQGSWYILSSLADMGNARNDEDIDLNFRKMSKNGQSSSRTMTMKARPLDIIFTRSGKPCIISSCKKELCLANVQSPTQRKTKMKPLPVKDFVNDTLKVSANPQDQMCIPDTNGCGVWKINMNTGQGQRYSMGDFPTAINATSSGTTLYCLTQEKKIIQRQEFPGSVTTECVHDSKSGDPAQLLVDAKTSSLLVVHQRVSDPSDFELSIHQFGNSRPVVDPIKLNWVPSVTKVNLTQTGDLVVLLAKEKNGMIVEYKRENLPSLFDIPGLLPQE